MLKRRARAAAAVVLATALAAGCGSGAGDEAGLASPGRDASPLASAAAPASAPATRASDGSPGQSGARAPVPPPTSALAADPGPSPASTSPGPAATSAPSTVAPALSSAAPAPANPAPPSEADASDTASGFSFEVAPIDGALRARMEPSSWREGCPVGLAELRYLTVAHWGFDGEVHHGELVVHASAVDALRSVFRDLFTAGFPIRRMRLVDDYGGDDYASIEDDNTSAFNCRPVTGSTDRWSRHAYGLAIDVNPLENPYVSEGATSHPASVPYLERVPGPGVIVEGGAAVAAFDSVGWEWGGRWAEPIDYQHFSTGG